MDEGQSKTVGILVNLLDPTLALTKGRERNGVNKIFILIGPSWPLSPKPLTGAAPTGRVSVQASD
jgi:hypothetical protein